MSKNLEILGRYSARMAAGDYDAVYDVFAPEFFSHLRMRDGKVVEHWGGPHCMNGIGLSPTGNAHTQSGTAA